MKCEICGRQYVALGVHLRHKHQIDPDDYRDEFGILRVTPLVDVELSAQLRAGANRRLQDDEYKAELQEQCRKNVAALKGGSGFGMSRAGKELLSLRNKKRNDVYLESIAGAVVGALREKQTLLDVRKTLGTSPGVVKKVAKSCGVEYSAVEASKEGHKRASQTKRDKAKAKIASLAPVIEIATNASDFCRLANLPYSTYKRWCRNGLMKRIERIAA